MLGLRRLCFRSTCRWSVGQSVCLSDQTKPSLTRQQRFPTTVRAMNSFNANECVDLLNLTCFAKTVQSDYMTLSPLLDRDAVPTRSMGYLGEVRNIRTYMYGCADEHMEV